MSFFVSLSRSFFYLSNLKTDEDLVSKPPLRWRLASVNYIYIYIFYIKFIIFQYYNNNNYFFLNKPRTMCAQLGLTIK